MPALIAEGGYQVFELQGGEWVVLLLSAAAAVLAIAVGFFIWAARTGQFDDLETPPVRMLFDDEEPRVVHPPSGAPASTRRVQR